MNALKAASASGASQPMSQSEAPVSLSPRAIWDLLVQDSGAGVMICDTSGKLAYVNDRFAKYINHPSAATVSGKMIHEIYPEQAAAERLAIIRRAANERRPLVVESVWNGVAFQSILRPLSLMGGDPNTVACIVRHQPKPAVDDIPASVERIHIRSNNLGPLSTLTMRELELLALIGEGLSSQDIAKKISRSIKTVEAHRASLGKKLGVASRVALARIAAESNLHFDQLQSRQVVRGRLAERTPPAPAGN